MKTLSILVRLEEEVPMYAYQDILNKKWSGWKLSKEEALSSPLVLLNEGWDTPSSENIFKDVLRYFPNDQLILVIIDGVKYSYEDLLKLYPEWFI